MRKYLLAVFVYWFFKVIILEIIFKNVGWEMDCWI